MSLIPTADKSAHPAGFMALIAPLIFRFVLNLSRTFDTIVTMINEGKTIAVVAINAPKIPEVVNPANVATFIPTGPGVIEDIASISVNCFVVYQ